MSCSIPLAVKKVFSSIKLRKIKFECNVVNLESAFKLERQKNRNHIHYCSAFFHFSLCATNWEAREKKMRNVSATLPSSASFKLICFLKSLFFLSLLKELVLKPGTELRELWTKAPFPLTFKVYVFNITNPQEVTDGGKVCIYLLMRWKLLIFCVFFL